MALGEIIGFEEKLAACPKEVVQSLHFTLFGKFAKPNFAKRNIRAFTGFNFKADSEIAENHLKVVSEQLSVIDLKRVCDILNAEYITNTNATVLAKSAVTKIFNMFPDQAKSDSEMQKKCDVVSNVPSRKSSNYSNTSAMSRKSRELKAEIIELKDAILKKQCSLLEIDETPENCARIEKGKQFINLLETRIKNKEALLEMHLDTHTEIETISSENTVTDVSKLSKSAVTGQHSKENDFAKLTNSIEKVLSRQVVGNNLKPFDGTSCLKWPSFLLEFRTSSRLCGFSDAENVMRLEKCLFGEARAAVDMLLLSAQDPEIIIDILSQKYGNEDVLIAELVGKAKTAPLASNNQQLMELNIVVRNIAAAAGNLEGFTQHKELLKEFCGKLPSHLLIQWGEYLMNNHIEKNKETVHDFSDWIQRIANITSRINLPSTSRDSIYGVENTRSTPYLRPAINSKTCGICKESAHKLTKCEKFLSADVKKRWKLAQKMNACYCCLEVHKGTCVNRKQCIVNNCQRFHHNLLHKNNSDALPEIQLATNDSKNNSAMLKIVYVHLVGPKGKAKVKAIFDEGSTTTLIDADLASQLGLEGPNIPLCCRWTGDVFKTDETSKKVKVRIGAGDQSKFFDLIGVRTVKDLKLPSQKCNVQKLKELFPYANSIYYAAWEDDADPLLLIGQNNAHLIVSRQTIQPSYEQPIISRTSLGWVLHGPVSNSILSNKKAEQILACEICDDQTHEEVKRYFTLENFGVCKPPSIKMSASDDRALQIAKESIRKVKEKYEIALPWKEDPPKFPKTKNIAMHRLIFLEKRLLRDQKLANAYRNEIKKLIDKKYAIRTTDNEISEARVTWFLPHFAVKNANKPDKVRVVFDAACKVEEKCLNDFLLCGPDYVTSLFGVLNRFRQNKIAFVGDIKEMFNRVDILDEDSFAQCFLWRDLQTNKSPQIYRMKAMLFGTKSSPFLAQFVKNYNANQHKIRFPEACQAIIEKHYVDDYLDGAMNTVDAVKRIKEVIYIHSQGGFEINNFVCNSLEVLQQIPEKLVAKFHCTGFEAKEVDVQRVLGMTWNACTDTFIFTFKFHKIDTEIINGTKEPTKRQVLKTAMSVFDPIGLLTPVSIKVRLLLQQIWRSKIGWDDYIGETKYQQWKFWLNELRLSMTIDIPRFIPSHEAVELHIFNDASEEAYATCIYLRVKQGNEIQLYLVAAKARVSPLKTITIPKLELLAAVMGCRLSFEVQKYWNISKQRLFYWTDSQTVLKWINTEKKLQSFVASRVGEILQLTEASQWHWVPTEHNVADICTRGKPLTKFNINSAWFKGPDFLYSDCDKWPKLPNDHTTAMNDEILCLAHSENIDNAESYLPVIKGMYRFNKLLRTTAWIKRFIDNARQTKQSRKFGTLTTDELQWSEMQWWKEVQAKCFPIDLHNIKGNRPNKTGRLSKVSLYIDENNILRVDTRIKTFDIIMAVERQPVVLDGRHPYVRLEIEELHRKFGHQGTQIIINELKRKYYIPKIHSIVKNVIRGCLRCRKRSAKATQPKMGLLPNQRFTMYEKPFTTTGVDYFGPFYVKCGRKLEKRYGVLFCCMTTRAIHVEIAHSLSTDSCIMAIKRFLARRGMVKIFWSDNGTNLRGASRELVNAFEEMNEKNIEDECSKQGINWKFIPPYAPHMGGAWERLIGCFKRALYAIMKEKHPTEEVLATLFTEVEHMVNSRPLTYVSNDPQDLCSITPNDFLNVGAGNIYIPGKFSEHDMLLKRQWRITQYFANIFWKRWLREYIPTLINRSKWQKGDSNLEVGEIVVLNEYDLPRGQWSMGVISQLYPGEDNIVRVVDVKTATGTYRRAANKIHRLNIRTDEEVSTGGQDVKMQLPEARTDNPTDDERCQTRQ